MTEKRSYFYRGYIDNSTIAYSLLKIATAMNSLPFCVGKFKLYMCGVNCFDYLPFPSQPPKNYFEYYKVIEAQNVLI